MPRYCECGSYASFGYAKHVSIKSIGMVNKRTHCSKCKLHGMINLSTPRCRCGKVASFGETNLAPWGKNQRCTHCVKCKTSTMIYLRSRETHTKRKYIVTAIGS